MRKLKTYWLVTSLFVLIGLVFAIFYSRQIYTSEDSGTAVETTDYIAQLGDSITETNSTQDQYKGREEPSIELQPTHRKPPEKQTEIRSEADQLLDDALEDGIEAALKFMTKFKGCQSSKELIVIAGNQANFLEENYPAYKSQSEQKGLDDLLIQAEDKEFDCNKFLGKAYDEDGTTVDRILNRVENEAENGSAIAKFLYAMWTPNDRESFVIGLDATAQYERKARRFTSELRYDNAQLWLLSLGLSYSSGKNFTPMRTSFGTTYLLAAKFCGLSLPIIEQQLRSNQRMIEILKIQGISTSDEELATVANYIALENCL